MTYLHIAAMISLAVLLPVCQAFVSISSTRERLPLSRIAIRPALFANTGNVDPDEEEEEIDWDALSAELVSEDEDDGLNDGEWLPDREKALQRNERARIYVEKVQAAASEAVSRVATGKTSPTTATKSSPYTDEEEEVIAAMGGKDRSRRREPGFLGDSTLQEIATDYSVPISYLADVLCMWGVPIPINIQERLGDLVTGEQAFTIVEAVNSLDVSALHDRYSNTNLLQLCYEWDIELQEAFDMAMTEGWSLPFGVQTCLRIEQENELLRVLGSQASQMEMPNYDYDDDF